MATLESVRLSGAYPAGSLSGGASEYARAIETEAKLQDGSARAAHGRLDSWKEISAYFGRSVRCVQRWERSEAMPVHRHRHRRGASVYAYRFELDTWWKAGSASSTHFADQG